MGMHQFQSYSKWAPVTSGVTQGSVLSSLIFRILIYDLNTNIVIKKFKFSDNTQPCHRAIETRMTYRNYRKISINFLSG